MLVSAYSNALLRRYIVNNSNKKKMFYQVTFPTVLRKTPLSRLWYKPDLLFSTPKVHVIIDFHCPLSSHSPEAIISTDLFVDLLVDYLNAYGKHQFVDRVNLFHHNS
jgi:insulysin